MARATAVPFFLLLKRWLLSGLLEDHYNEFFIRRVNTAGSSGAGAGAGGKKGDEM